MSLSLRFWGTRGSIPSPGLATARYGGNTPCVELRTAEGWLVILDAGTGIRELGRSLMSRANGHGVEGDIFLTHAHWDHIQGIPFFAPLFHRGNHFTIWGSRSLQTSIDRVVRDQMSPVVFPVTFEELQARIDFQELAEERRAGSGYEVAAMAVRHPGGALGYRFTESNRTGGGLVYVSDNELSAAARYDTPRGWRARFVEFVRGAAVLVHDTMYRAEEYRNFVGWGHSTYEDAVELALEASVDRLVLFHHHPERTDDEVDRCVAACRELVQARGARLEIIAAAEGMTLIV
ncbi:MAG: MBL fold metallo-hydrolase [Gemmatimonadaceae bacterium]|nr:MBL fold metallo-hydrolase [Gemmatimonadaceae bacterium]NUO94857.1 MBL fold metallo-hydrolase [Gemmatimonadaceae bacterium]NUP72494.1 MBL fold metallo-hydrolase [Gemmatimonadaceae bacterium]NUR35130.1 MBL fold metallo-hydrolase [Gemmatimonadaceae bacterium]NUS33738.1 MBL fold metallo-hydrolase [Gemmatimonadaceae bacterium]